MSEAAAARCEHAARRRRWLRPDLPPDLIVRAAEQFKSLIELLGGKEAILEPIAIWKFEGYSNDEIAQRLGCSRSKVARKLELIRKTWEGEDHG